MVDVHSRVSVSETRSVMTETALASSKLKSMSAPASSQ